MRSRHALMYSRPRDGTVEALPHARLRPYSVRIFPFFSSIQNTGRSITTHFMPSSSAMPCPDLLVYFSQTAVSEPCFAPPPPPAVSPSPCRTTALDTQRLTLVPGREVRHLDDDSRPLAVHDLMLGWWLRWCQTSPVTECGTQGPCRAVVHVNANVILQSDWTQRISTICRK